MSKIKLGIIGIGNMGSSHIKNSINGQIEGVELVAVCDTSKDRRDFVEKTYPDLKVFEDATSLYKSGLIDSVLIAVPHYDHCSLAIEAFSYGLNVLVEKPAGVYTKQVKEMNEAAAKSGKTYGIMYNQRTNPLYQKLKKLIENGELGHIKRINWTITDWYRPQAYHASSAWRSTWGTEGGGALINQNPHQLDLWQWMFGMPSKIYAKASFGKYYDIEVEDDVTAFLEYDNGTTGVYTTSTGEAPGTNRLEVACDMGKIFIEGGKMMFYRNEISEREFNKTNTVPFGRPEKWDCEININGKATNHPGIIKDFASAVLNGTPLLAPGVEGINGLTISNAMHLSAWTGETIDVKNLDADKFYNILQDKIKNSTLVKKVSDTGVADTAGTY